MTQDFLNKRIEEIDTYIESLRFRQSRYVHNRQTFTKYQAEIDYEESKKAELVMRLGELWQTN